MAASFAAVAGASHVEGNKRVRVYDVTFSSNYATGGEAYTAANFGLKKVEYIRPLGAAMATDLATALAVGVDYTNSKFVFFESGGSGAAQAEKTNSEAYPTGCKVRVEAVGY